MNIRKIGILGGSGFVGRTLASQLSNAGYELKALTRKRIEKRNGLETLGIVPATIESIVPAYLADK